jgi:hypothetical protein
MAVIWPALVEFTENARDRTHVMSDPDDEGSRTKRGRKKRKDEEKKNKKKRIKRRHGRWLIV